MKFNTMKIVSIAIFAAAAMPGCSGNAAEGTETASEPCTAVTLTGIACGNIREDIVLTATTAYLLKSGVTVPVPAYVVEVCAGPGDYVYKGQPLFVLESKESHVLTPAAEKSGKEPAGGPLLSEDGVLDWKGARQVSADLQSMQSVPSGMMVIRAGADGIVTDVAEQEGNYVPEGGRLCTIADMSGFVFLLNVPYGLAGYASPGSQCSIVFPDGTCLKASVGRPLAEMDESSQTMRVIARPELSSDRMHGKHMSGPAFLPEGMNVKALLPSGLDGGMEMLLPRSVVQSNESLTEHWVMRLSDDSTAVRVPVTLGYSNADSVEVRSPELSESDRIVLTGGYGLKDGGKVVIVKK